MKTNKDKLDFTIPQGETATHRIQVRVLYGSSDTKTFSIYSNLNSDKLANLMEHHVKVQMRRGGMFCHDIENVRGQTIYRRSFHVQVVACADPDCKDVPDRKGFGVPLPIKEDMCLKIANVLHQKLCAGADIKQVAKP